MGSNEETNAAGTDTRPPMLVESDYDSWKIRIHRYIRGKPLGKLIWNSIQNGPSPHPMVTDDPTEGLPRHIFNILNQTNTAKEIWDNVEMLMQGSGRTLQQRKEDLFDEFERFRAIGNEPIHDYFVRFHKLVNDMKITQLAIPTHQLNTKFVNNLPSYWGKYVTNVKQNMDISTTNCYIIPNLKALSSHRHKDSQKQEQSSSSTHDPLLYMAQATTNHFSLHTTLYLTTTTRLRCSGRGQNVTEPFREELQGIVGNTGSMTDQSFVTWLSTATGKKMLLMEAKEMGVTLGTRCKSSMHSSAPIWNTVDEGPIAADKLSCVLVIHKWKPMVQPPVKIIEGYASSGAKGNATGIGADRNMGTTTSNQSKVIHCYICRGKGHMGRHCTQPKRQKNSEWFKEKMLLSQAQEAGVILDEEQLAFLADTGGRVDSGLDTQTLPTTAIFKTDDLDAFDSDCDEASSASEVLMDKLSAYDSDALSQVPNYETYQDNNVID
ncbi:hypothetical protein Tco_0942660 [Tanacetum coccineum]